MATYIYILKTISLSCLMCGDVWARNNINANSKAAIRRGLRSKSKVYRHALVINKGSYRKLPIVLFNIHITAGKTITECCLCPAWHGDNCN